MYFLINITQNLDGIQQDGRCRSEQIGGRAGDNGSVRKFKCGGSGVILFGKIIGSGNNGTVIDRYLCLLHNKFLFVDLFFCCFVFDKTV